MLIVAVAALNFAVLRARVVGNQPMLLGALPMMNALTVALLAIRRARSRPFVVGFLAFGAIAVATYAVVVGWFDDQVKTLYLAPVLRYLVHSIGLGQPLILLPAEDIAIVVMLVLPQCVFALIGALISQKFVTSRRTSRRPVGNPA
jgi:hypothetical protein